MRARSALRPLNPVYAAATALRNLAYDHQWLPAQQLPAPVISVGNLSAGGAGKTPLVLALARLLQSAGWSPIILSRGYGRGSKAILRVDSNGTASQFGDEPLLLARSVEAPVYVGADRYRAGLVAAREIGLSDRHIFLLDDGFQHRRLAREANIVLLRAADLEDALLPAGNLREPAAALSRADVLVLREEERDSAAKFLSRFSPRSGKNPAVWTVRRSLDLSASSPGTAVAFAAIAHPAEFFRSLRDAGFTLPATLSFPDHYEYSFRDVTQILAALRSASTRTLLTTEKDFVRLGGQARQALQAAADLRAVPLLTEIVDAPACLQQLEALIGWQR